MKTFLSLFLLLLFPITSTWHNSESSGKMADERAFTSLHTEGFESDSEGSSYRSNGFDDGINDFWTRTNTAPKSGSTNNATFTGITGSFYWNGEDVDSDDNPLGEGKPAYFFIKTLDVSPYSGGTARISLDLAAERNHTGGWENDDTFIIQYAFDANIATDANSLGGLPAVANVETGTYTTAATFWGSGQPNPNKHLSLDSSVPSDGIGDNGEILTNAFTNYSFDFNIPSGASKMSVRFFFNGATSEVIGFDDIKVSAEAGVPAPISAEVVATVLLEGAYNGTTLTTSINGSIPTTQPYSTNGHSGGSAVSIPAGAVDWVLVELREAGSAANALNSSRRGSSAGFLMSDGTIKATDGTSNLSVSLSGNSGTDYFVVIYHRNHLPIMSANAVAGSSGTLTIDFTSNSATTFQTTTALVSLSGGKFGMPAGDTDSDGDIDSDDLSTWRTNNGVVFSYSGSGVVDFNLDGVINAVDRNSYHQKNMGKTRQVPST